MGNNFKQICCHFIFLCAKLFFLQNQIDLLFLIVGWQVLLIIL